MRIIPCVLQSTHLPESMHVTHTSNNVIFNLVRSFLEKTLGSLSRCISISLLEAKVTLSITMWGLFSGQYMVFQDIFQLEQNMFMRKRVDSSVFLKG